MMKRILLVLVLMMALVMLTSRVTHAEETPLTIGITGPEYVAPSAPFEVVVDMKNAVDLVGFQMRLLYNVDQFTFDGLTESEDLTDVVTLNSNTPGVLTLNYLDIDVKINGDVDLFTLTFIATSGVDTTPQPVIIEEGVYNNEFVTLDALDVLGRVLDFVFDLDSYEVRRGLMGDVNLDSALSIHDAAMVKLFSIGLIDFDPTQEELADVNGDGFVSIFDVAQIQQTIANAE